jgi:probable HAF family extracellular repeat protein
LWPDTPWMEASVVRVLSRRMTLGRCRTWQRVAALVIAATLYPSVGDAQSWEPTDLDALEGWEISSANAVSDTGVVVGFFRPSFDQVHAFVWRGPGDWTDLGTLGGTFASATGINAVGRHRRGSRWPTCTATARTRSWPGSGRQDCGATPTAVGHRFIPSAPARWLVAAFTDSAPFPSPLPPTTCSRP